MGLGEAVSYCYAWEYLFDSALRLRREQDMVLLTSVSYDASWLGPCTVSK
jgi:hypothetical protein